MSFEIRQVVTPDDPVLTDISEWICNWWEETSEYEKNRMLAYYKRSVFKNRLPQTFVALKDGKAVGTFQFGMGDTFVRPDLFPWLKHVYVIPEHRKQGCASEMMKFASERIRNSGYECFYLFTHLNGFYERFGWSFTELFESYDPDLGVQRMYTFKIDNKKRL